MKFGLKISSENAAFADNPEYETARLLRQTADRLENGIPGGMLMDINGNRVGHWDLEVPEDEYEDNDEDDDNDADYFHQRKSQRDRRCNQWRTVPTR